MTGQDNGATASLSGTLSIVAGWKGAAPSATVSKPVPVTAWDGRYFVFLEGPDDVEIIANRWFPHLAKNIIFQSGDPVSGSASGCSAVVAEVKRVGKKAFGIIDRDYLLKPASLGHFLDANDANFRETDCFVTDYPDPAAGDRFGERILVLTRWELENFLFDKEAFLRLISDRKSSKTAGKTEGQLIVDLLASVEAMLPVSAARLAICRAVGKPRDLSGDHRVEYLPAEIVEGRVIEKVLPVELPDVSDHKAAYKAEREKIALFEGKADAAPEQKIEAALRIVDGKKLVVRVSNSFGFKDEIVFDLATRISALKRVPSEIEKFLTEIITHGAVAKRAKASPAVPATA